MIAQGRLVSAEAVVSREVPGLSSPAFEVPVLPPRTVLPSVSRNTLAMMLFMASDMAAFTAALWIAQPVIAPGGVLPGGLFMVLIGLALTGLAGLYRRQTWEADELGRISAVALIFAVLAVGSESEKVSVAVVIFATVGAGISVLRMLLRAIPVTARLMRPTMVLVGLGMDRDSFAYQMRAGRLGAPMILRGAPVRGLTQLGPTGFYQWLQQVAARAHVPVQSLQIVLVPTTREAAGARRLGGWLASLGQPHAVAVTGTDASHLGAANALVRSVGADVVLAEVTPRRPMRVAEWMKRGLDLLLTAVALVVLAPVLAVISLGLLWEGGPVLFRQCRVGRAGRRFTCYKFRTMRPDAEDRLALLLDCDPVAAAEWARHQKLVKDPRVTRLGALLRASSLDELPQLFNVLLGDMSLVGPRPIIAPEVPGYPADHAYFHGASFADYASCTPGLTGLWQVCGRHRTSHAERVRLDCWYARNWSVWLDLLILARTVRVVAMGDGR